MNDLKLELIRMTYMHNAIAEEAIKEAEKLYDFVNGADSKVEISGNSPNMKWTKEEIDSITKTRNSLINDRRNYDEKVDMGSSA